MLNIIKSAYRKVIYFGAGIFCHTQFIISEITQLGKEYIEDEYGRDEEEPPLYPFDKEFDIRNEDKNG